MITEIVAFFLLVCTPDNGGEPDPKCVRQMNECFIYGLQQSKQIDPWHIAENCSEENWD